MLKNANPAFLVLTALGLAAGLQAHAQSAPITPAAPKLVTRPATETVAFSYTLPADVPLADLVLRDLLGREVARQPLAARAGQVGLSVRHLPAGFYTSALETAGSRLFSQKLTVAR